MADFDAIQKALRAHALSVTICSTGLVSLALTETGFTRTDGSFVDDGFERGMEITHSGFAPNVFQAVVTSVSPTDLRITPFIVSIANGSMAISYPPIQPLGLQPGRMLTAAMPSIRALENEAPSGTTIVVPGNMIPYLEEEFSRSTARKVGFPIKQSRTEYTGEYFLKWHGVPNVGASAMRKGIGALEKAFESGTVISAGIDSVHIDSDPAPTTEGIIQTTSRPVLILSIPWVVRSL